MLQKDPFGLPQDGKVDTMLLELATIKSLFIYFPMEIATLNFVV